MIVSGPNQSIEISRLPFAKTAHELCALRRATRGLQSRCRRSLLYSVNLAAGPLERDEEKKRKA